MWRQAILYTPPHGTYGLPAGGPVTLNVFMYNTGGRFMENDTLTAEQWQNLLAELNDIEGDGEDLNEVVTAWLQGKL